MKALKEKRVSLRSLFRRSLVILSLLALAFAVMACPGSSADTENPDTSNPPTGTGVVDPVLEKYVEMIEVLQHPNMYSLEGAAPNLSGIEVAVYWYDPATKLRSVDYANAADLTVNPPVAALPKGAAAGTSWTTVSTFLDYTVSYSGDAVSKAGAVNVYIPAVRALTYTAGSNPAAWTTYMATYVTVFGSPDPFFEDLPFEVKGVQIKAQYAALTAGTGIGRPPQNAAGDAYGPARLPAKYDWKDLPQGDDTGYAAAHQSAWVIAKAAAPNTATATTLEYIPIREYPDQRVTGGNTVKAGYFYYVDRIIYKENTATKLRDFWADEEDTTIGGTGIDWLTELENSGAQFDVIYYTGEGQTEYTDGAKRTIGMKDYIKAMKTVDLNTGQAKATKPALVGGPLSTNPASTSLLQSAAIDDWEPRIALFYYHDGIIGTYESGAYVTANNLEKDLAKAAQISLADYLWIFAGVDKVAVKGLASNTPQVLVNSAAPGGSGGPYQRATPDKVMDATATYYHLVYTYTKGSETVDTWTKWGYEIPRASWTCPIFTQAVIDALDPEDESDEYDVSVPLPLSGGANQRDDITIQFQILP